MQKFVKWKNIFRIMCLTLLIAYFFAAPIFILPKVAEFKKNLFNAEKLMAGEVLELWNVESFEGGSASRGNFLEKLALNFENKFKGNFIIVKTMSLNQAVFNLEQGNLPNIVSFGIGFGEYILPQLINLNSGFGVKDKFCEAGKYGSNLKAVPFCYSGYFAIKNGEIGDGQTGYAGAESINPLKAIDKVEKMYNKSKNLSSYDVYADFVDAKFENLIGTARDFCRCKNRENNGRMNNISYMPLNKYTDLVQYLGVVNGKSTQTNLSQQFIKFVLEKENQKKLTNIGLFSPVIDIYNSSSHYFEAEQQFNNIRNILNVFYDKAHIDKFKEDSLNKLEN